MRKTRWHTLVFHGVRAEKIQGAFAKGAVVDAIGYTKTRTIAAAEGQPERTVVEINTVLIRPHQPPQSG